MRRTSTGPPQRPRVGARRHAGAALYLAYQGLSASVMILLRETAITKSGRILGRCLERDELVPGTHGLCRQVTLVVRGDRSLERYACCDLDTGFGQSVELGRIVGEQHDPRAVERS